MSEEAIHLDWHAAPASDPVERVARALCRHDGQDPDALVPNSLKEVGLTVGSVADLQPADEPAWKAYALEATRFIVAMHAFQSGLDPTP